MTLYFWNKYNADAHTSPYSYYTDGSWGSWGGTAYVPGNSTVSGYTSYSFNSSTGYTYSGYFSANMVTCPYTYYKGSGTSITEYNVYSSADGGQTVGYQARTKSATQQTGYSTYYTQGSLITTTQEAYDAHTSGQRNSDGYWWVRGELASAPTITSPNGNESIDAVYDITWSIPADAAGGGLQTQVQLSSDDGSTWKDVVPLTAANASDYSYDFSNVTSSSASLIRARFYDPAHSSYGPWDQSDGVFTIQHNQGPTAPTNLSPDGGVSKDRAKTIRFSWQHNDPNSNDPQSKFDFQWRQKGNTTWNVATQTTPNQYYDMDSNIFPHGSIEWQVRTYDQAGLASPYSALATFLAGDKPAKPTFTSPTNGANVPIANPTVQWSSIGQTGFTLTVKDSSGNQVYSYSGTTNKAVTIQYDLANGAVYTFNLSITNADNLTSDIASENITVSYTPPEKPILAVSHDNERGSISILINDPTPTGTEPTVTYNEVFRRIDIADDWLRLETNLKINSTYSDYTPASNQTYEYYVRAWGDNGTFSDSDIISESVSISNAQIALLSDPSQWIGVVLNDKSGGPDRSFKHNLDRTLMQFAGREYPIAEFSEIDSLSIGLSFLVQGKEDMDMLRQLAYSRETLLYRDSRGRREFVTIDSLDESDYPFRDWYSVSVNPMRVSFVEGV